MKSFLRKKMHSNIYLAKVFTINDFVQQPLLVWFDSQCTRDKKYLQLCILHHKFYYHQQNKHVK